MRRGELMESGQVCTQCGRPTDGTWSEGGAKWALCEECFERTFRTPARPSRRIFLTHIRLDIARDFWHATLQRAG